MLPCCAIFKKTRKKNKKKRRKKKMREDWEDEREAEEAFMEQWTKSIYWWLPFRLASLFFFRLNEISGRSSWKYSRNLLPVLPKLFRWPFGFISCVGCFFQFIRCNLQTFLSSFQFLFQKCHATIQGCYLSLRLEVVVFCLYLHFLRYYLLTG